jgi:hypothetical protein
MKRLRALVVLMAMFGNALATLAEDNEIEKTWTFQGRDGAVEIKLTRFVDKKGPTSLNIFSPDGTPRSVIEEAGFLTSVLESLTKEGVDLESLDLINFRLQEKEAISRVAVRAALSVRWRKALNTRRTSVVYPLVTSFLNDSGAYKEWDHVFKLHGLTLRVAGVEEVIMEPFSQTQTECPTGADCRDLLVPKDALIQINVESTNRHP